MTDEIKTNEVIVPETVTEIAAPDMSHGLLGMAIQAGAGVDEIKAIMELQERQEDRAARKAYVVAMTKFKAKNLVITKNNAVSFGKTQYDHSTLDHILSIAVPEMSECGLSHRWDTENSKDDGIKVTCVITHEMGHSEGTYLTSAADDSGGKNKIQGIGSAVTYLQRYTFLSAMGLSTGGDDTDGISKGVISTEQRDEILARLDDCEGDVMKFCEYMEVDSITNIQSRDYGKADTALKGKEKAFGKAKTS